MSPRPLLPVLVLLMPDVLGSDFANTLCVDSSRGNVETYLAQDIPAWVAANLQAAAGPASWAIGGLSFGGTCALQLALRRPDVYGRMRQLTGELRAAGADVSTLELPGAHSWSVWRPGLAQSLPWLAAHTALICP